MKTKIDKSQFTPWLALLGFCYLWFVRSAISMPLIADEPAFAIAADNFLKGEIFLTHPPFYVPLLALLRLSGVSYEGLRYLGAACFIINLTLIYALCVNIFKTEQGKKTGILAAFLFAINPLALRGSLILDIDNTILSTISLFFAFYFLKSQQESGIKHSLLLAALLCIGFWAKLSTPILLIGAVFIFYLLKFDFKSACFKTASIAAPAVAGFLLSWYLVSYIFQLPFGEIFGRVTSVLSKGYSQRPFSIFAELIDRAARFTLWAGPFLILLASLPLVSRFKQYLKNIKTEAEGIDFIIILSAIIFAGYICVGGVIYSFPKYHYPILPFLAILAAFAVAEIFAGEKRLYSYFALIIPLWIVYNILVPGDLLLAINQKLRFTAILEPEHLRPVLAYTAVKGLLYIIPALALYFMFRRGYAQKTAIVSMLFCAVLAGSLSMDYMQYRATYFTTYLYGRSVADMAGLTRYIKERCGAGPMIAPEDVLFKADLPVSYPYCNWGKTAALFAQAVSDKKTSCVIYGLSWNSIFQYRNIFSDPAVKSALTAGYAQSQLGEYTIWQRK